MKRAIRDLKSPIVFVEKACKNYQYLYIHTDTEKVMVCGTIKQMVADHGLLRLNRYIAVAKEAMELMVDHDVYLVGGKKLTTVSRRNYRKVKKCFNSL